MVDIIKWNMARNNLVFDPCLEVKMLSEEANEFMTATSLAERLREYSDFVFVWTGTQAKYFALKPTSPLDLSYKAFSALSEWVTAARTFMEDALYTELHGYDKFYKLLGDCLRAVTDANNAKGTVKDESGKVVKGPNYVSPSEAIAKLLKEYTHNED